MLDEEKLSHSHIPSRLPHREEELKKIRYALETGSGPLLVYGRTGVGKTAASRLAARLVADLTGTPFAYVNCSFSPRTASRVLSEIIRQLSDGMPDRGISFQDRLSLLETIVADLDGGVGIILDEVQDLTKGGEELVYSLLRLHENGQAPSLNRLVVIYRAETRPQFLAESSTLSFFTLKLRFRPYTQEQLVDILRARAQEALRPGTFSNDALMEIARLTASYQEGNARYALSLLRAAALLAESEGSRVLDVEHVRRAEEGAEVSTVDLSILESLDLHDQLILLAVAKLQSRLGERWVTMGALKEEYRVIAEGYGVPAFKHTATWRRVKDLGALGILEIRRSGKGMRGQTTLISLRAPPEELSEIVEGILNRKVGKWPIRTPL